MSDILYDPDDPLISSSWAHEQSSFQRIAPKYERDKSESPPIDKFPRPKPERRSSSHNRVKKHQPSLADRALLSTLYANQPVLANEGGEKVLDLDSSPEGLNKTKRAPDIDKDRDEQEQGNERGASEDEDEENENQPLDYDEYIYREIVRREKAEEKRGREKIKDNLPWNRPDPKPSLLQTPANVNPNQGNSTPKVLVDSRSKPQWKSSQTSSYEDHQVKVELIQSDSQQESERKRSIFGATPYLGGNSYWKSFDEKDPLPKGSSAAQKSPTSPTEIPEFKPNRPPTNMTTTVLPPPQPKTFLNIRPPSPMHPRLMEPPLRTAPLPSINSNRGEYRRESWSTPTQSYQLDSTQLGPPNRDGGQHYRSNSENTKLPKILDPNVASPMPSPASPTKTEKLPSIDSIIQIQQAEEASTNIIREQQRQRKPSMSSPTGLSQPSPYAISPYTGGAGSPTSSNYLGTSPRQEFGAQFQLPSPNSSLPRDPLPPKLPVHGIGLHTSRISISTSVGMPEPPLSAASTTATFFGGSSHASPSDGHYSSTDGLTPQTNVTTPSERDLGSKAGTFVYDDPHATSPRTLDQPRHVRMSPVHQHPQISLPMPLPPIQRRQSLSGEMDHGLNGVPGGYKCEYPGCNAQPFQTQYLLNSHATVHSKYRPHFCSEPGCPRGKGGKGFKRKNEMKRHGLVHSSPGYECPYCPERDHKYPRPDNLQRHVKVHHPDISMADIKLRQVLDKRPGGVRGAGRRRKGSG